MEFLKEKKILIVDDDKTTRLALNLLLKDLGSIEIFEASSVSESLKIINENQVDLIVSDYIMPEQTGLDFYKSLILNDIHIPFAMVTANSDADSVKEMIDLGIHAILVKPVTKEMLISRLSKII